MRDEWLGKVDPSSVGTDCNCHGLSLAGGNIIIEDISENADAITAILNDDGYIVSDYSNASLIVVIDDDNRPVHSVLKYSVSNFSADHGEGLPTLNVNYETAMAGSIIMNNLYFRRKSKDKKINTKSGQTSKGIRTMNNQEIKKIIEDTGLESTQELIDSIYYSR